MSQLISGIFYPSDGSDGILTPVKVEEDGSLVAGGGGGPATDAATNATLEAVAATNHADLLAIKALLASSVAFSETVWEDSNGVYYIRTKNSDSTVTTKLVTGSTYVPVGTSKPAGEDSDIEIEQFSYTAITNTAEWQEDQDLIQSIYTDLSTSPALTKAVVWRNLQTGSVIANPPIIGTDVLKFSKSLSYNSSRVQDPTTSQYFWANKSFVNGEFSSENYTDEFNQTVTVSSAKVPGYEYYTSATGNSWLNIKLNGVSDQCVMFLNGVNYTTFVVCLRSDPNSLSNLFVTGTPLLDGPQSTLRFNCDEAIAFGVKLTTLTIDVRNVNAITIGLFNDTPKGFTIVYDYLLSTPIEHTSPIVSVPAISPDYYREGIANHPFLLNGFSKEAYLKSLLAVLATNVTTDSIGTVLFRIKTELENAKLVLDNIQAIESAIATNTLNGSASFSSSKSVVTANHFNVIGPANVTSVRPNALSAASSINTGSFQSGRLVVSSAANIGSWIAEDSLDNMTFFPVQLYETLTNTTTVEGVNATVSSRSFRFAVTGSYFRVRIVADLNNTGVRFFASFNQAAFNGLNSTATITGSISGVTNTVTVKADTPAAQLNAFKVDGSATTQPVSVAGLPLPLGAATAAIQGSIETRIAATNTILNSVNAKIQTLGQNTIASSSPVVLPAVQITDLATQIESRLRLSPLAISTTAPAYQKYRTLPTALLTIVPVVVKASPGAIYSLRVYNSGAQVVFLKLYNSATAVIVGTAVPIETIPIAPNTFYEVQTKEVPWETFAAGIVIAATTGLLDTNNVAPVIGLYVSIRYV